MKRVLFVCLGNICRSPLAHAVGRAYIEAEGLGHRVEVDSCGTSGYHNGEQANRDTRRTARARGVDMEWHRSRRLRESDYTDFDVLVAMDASNERVVHTRMPRGATCEVVRFMDYVPGASSRDVPDPYYEGGFDGVQDIVESGIPVLIGAILEKDRPSAE